MHGNNTGTIVLGLSYLESVEIYLGKKREGIYPLRLSSDNLLIINGGQRRDRTADAGLFRAALQWK